ncbi:hypothetical protein TRFO_14188 [Tritrichomonas foetus]|uniref:Uncharacterized protein n=1 Tax=Tritrichomonas foetus TaxID=1144522 RepID=A0A1J4KVM5_9EUKA|nr:hypothetical protein TRFO_14188 [Tritrichomonas foetus]|eukprot:OHT15287.1 hypothetical protein TRFO_14188 [Tritrichomonas foetus]
MDFSVIWENKEEIKINIWEHAANMKTLQRLCQQKETKYFVQSKTSYQNLVDFLNFNNMRNECNCTNNCKETMINERNVFDMKRLSEEFESNKIEEAVCEFLKSNEDYSKVISYLQIENEGNIEDNRILEEIISQNLLQIYQQFPKLLHKLSFSQLDRIFSSFSSNFLESKITENNEQSIIFDIIEYLYSSNRNQNLNENEKEKEKENVQKEKSQMFLLFQHVNFNLIDDERTFIFLKHLEQFEKNNFFLSNLVDKLHQRITSKDSEIEFMKNEYSSRIDFLEHELDNIKMQFLEIQQNISKHQQENEAQVKKHIQEHNKEHEKLINNIDQIDRDLNDKLKNYQTINDEMKQKNKEYEQNLENQLSQIQEQKREITRLKNLLKKRKYFNKKID